MKCTARIESREMFPILLRLNLWFDTTQFHTSLFAYIIHATFQLNCAEGLHFSAFHSVCMSVCVFSLFWHLAQSGVQTAVSATSARYGHEI